MQIEIHGLTLVMHGMKDGDVRELCNDILHVDYDVFKLGTFGNCRTLKHAFGKSKESVFIRINNPDTDKSNVRLTLHGYFFDCSRDFRLEKLLKLARRFSYTPKQLDVAFNDDKECLNIDKIRHWCKFDYNYCIGNLVERAAPREVTSRGNLEMIQLGSAKSKTNFGTIYVRENTGFVRIEIKFKNKNKIRYLLEDFKDKKPEQFESRSLELLVGCIEFVTPPSKKSGRKYKRQPPWKAFLGSDIKRAKWSTRLKEKFNNRVAADKETVAKKVRRTAVTVRNMVKECSPITSKDEIYKEFAVSSGYMLENVDGN